MTCIPNQNFKNDCNICTCDSTGSFATCTTISCDKGLRQKRDMMTDDCNDEIKSSKYEVVGCRHCWCSDGKEICDATQCLNDWKNFESKKTGKSIEEPQDVQEILHPETSKEVDNPDDVSFTINEIESPNFSCDPGKSFTVECNRCWCAKNGREPKTCTRIACNPKVYKPLPTN